MNNNKSTRESGIGFCGFLTLVFIVLKLCKVIDWSWLWVLSPLWIPVALIIVGFIPFYFVYKKRD